jgi:histidinol-phosphatase (PHP family)
VIVDYHMHLRGPAEGREGPIDHRVEAVEPYVETAAARGVDEIGFTEHLYHFRQARGLCTVRYQTERCRYDLDAYCDAVGEAKRRGLPVKLGVEADYVPGREAEIVDALAPYPWDFVVGSVHWLDGEAVDIEPGVWSRLPVEEVWRRYFVLLRGLARSGVADVLAHPDLPKIFGRRPDDDELAFLYEETADAIEAAGVAVEVSTAGLRRPVAEVYPAPEFLERCRARGIGATTASDAHVFRDVGRDFEQAVELMRAAGYDTVTVFDGRQSRQEPLG